MSLSKVAYGWKFYLHLLNVVPIQTKAVTAAVLAYLGNVLTQKVFEKSPKMNHTRALKFVAYYLILVPIAHYWYKLLDVAFPKKKEKDGNAKPSLIDSSVLKKLAADELLFDPFCIVFFYTVISILERKNPSEIKDRIVENYWPTQKASWKLWPMVQLVNFAVIPGHLRILFINVVSFFWGIFLQVQAGKVKQQ